VSTLLTGISASVTTIGIRSTASMPSSGVLHIGRSICRRALFFAK
jgi:hypothetical protein